jgi:hypothetical protein
LAVLGSVDLVKLETEPIDLGGELVAVSLPWQGKESGLLGVAEPA